MSDDELSEQPPAKLSFTIEERKLLLMLISKHYEIVNNKKIDGKTTSQKNQAWESIHNEFLTHTNVVRVSRTPQQLRRCWENLRCKAKKGDRLSQKLLKWGEYRYKLFKNGDISEETQFDDDEFLSGFEDDDLNLQFSSKEGLGCDRSKNNEIDVEKSLRELKQLVSCTDSQHCPCDKAERTARIELLILEKRRKEIIYNMKLQNLLNKSKREKEIHLLTVEELTLRAQNEKRKAEILEKEMSHYI